jgi:NADPH-dependent 7-cyano-7-deazaguanine reductase QueF
MRAPVVRKHESGLRTQEVTGPAVAMVQRHEARLPAMCPVSGNPRPRSTLTLSYRAAGWCVEVYSLDQLLTRFVGGWRGSERYPAERNMEGAVALIAQMVADAVGVPVRFRALLVLDASPMRLAGTAEPSQEGR